MSVPSRDHGVDFDETCFFLIVYCEQHSPHVSCYENKHESTRERSADAKLLSTTAVLGICNGSKDTSAGRWKLSLNSSL